jgi:hypothetical protein
VRVKWLFPLKNPSGLPVGAKSRQFCRRARPRELAMRQSLRTHKWGDSGNTESLRSSAKSTLCSVAKTGQGECGQPGCSRCQAHVLVMEATGVGA